MGKKAGALGDTVGRIKDEISQCNTVVWKHKNGEGEAESEHRGG